MKVNLYLVKKIEGRLIKLAIDCRGNNFGREQIVNGLANDFKLLKNYTQEIGTGCIICLNKFFDSQKQFDNRLRSISSNFDTPLPAKCLWESLRRYLQEIFSVLLNMYSNTDISENEFKKLLRKIGK